MKNNKKGYLLPMVIIYMVTAMIVGTGIVLLGSLDRIEANKRLHREQAFYLAEAGINYARFQLKQNSSWVPPSSPINLGAGSFQLIQTVNGNTVTDTSTGTVKGITEKTSINLTKSGGLFANGIFGATSLKIENVSVMDGYDSRKGPYSATNVDSNQGDAGSNLYISVSNNGLINGDASVSAGGNIVEGIQGDITGDTSLDAPFQTLSPIIIPNGLTGLGYPVQGDSRITGSYTIDSGRLIVTGTAEISGGDFHFNKIYLNNNTILNITGNSRFYIETGGFHLSNNSHANLGATVLAEVYSDTALTTLPTELGKNSYLNYPGDPTHLGIYITNNVTQMISNNCFISATIYAPRAPVIIKNNGGFFGTIVANSVYLAQSAAMHYDIALRTHHPPGDPGGGPPVITFVSWTKPDWKK